MIKRFLAALLLVAPLNLVGAPGASAQGAGAFDTLYAFGDSLTDTGNLFALSGGFEPPSPPYFDGRFSDGPVWVESLAPLLGLTVDFDTDILADPLANNQAIAGAFTDTRGEAGEGTGVLSQVGNFLGRGGAIGPNDLVVLWAGANNYFGGDRAPSLVVGDLAEAVAELAQSTEARHFLVLNLPNLGDTPGGRASGAGLLLNTRTGVHNALLAKAMAGLRAVLDVEIVLLDVNTLFASLLANPDVFGFDNTTEPCLIQQPDGSRIPSGACPPDGDSFDADGVLFWDLIHPSAAAHKLIAQAAFTTLVAAGSLQIAAGN